MTATRVTWGQAFWAVVAASIMAAFALLVPLFLLAWMGLPFPVAVEVSGRGWPWRIEGPWSLVADIGPLLLVGAVFAWFAEAYTSRHTSVPTRRLPIALTAALLGWVTINRPTNAGLIGAGGLATFLALLVVTREMSGRERRPWRWTPRTAWAALVLVSVLVPASVSYGLLHPLNAEQAQANSGSSFDFSLRNDGRADVRVLSVAVASVPSRALVAPADSYESSPDDPDSGMVPLAGRTIAGSASERVTIVRTGRCFPPRTIDRVNVRLRVLGRTVDQVVRIEPVSFGCA